MSYKTLREEHYFKTGRKGVVLEFVDNLAPNLLDDNRNIGSQIFKKSSRIKATLIDSRRTNGAAKPVDYNFDTGEILLLNYILSDGVVSAFKKRAGAYKETKGEQQIFLRDLVETFDSIDFQRFDRVMDYSKDSVSTGVMFQKNIKIGQDDLLIKKIYINYEEAASSNSKWKVTIEEGVGKRDTSKGNGLNILKYGSYSKTNSGYLMLQTNELIIPISEGAKRASIAQSPFYALMIDSRSDFTKRKLMHKDYEGESIAMWNPQGVAWYDRPENQNSIRMKNEELKKEIKKEGNSNVSNNTVETENDRLCKDCGVKIDENVYNYSNRFYKRPLCFNCQKIEKAKGS